MLLDRNLEGVGLFDKFSRGSSSNKLRLLVQCWNFEGVQLHPWTKCGSASGWEGNFRELFEEDFVGFGSIF